MAAAPEDDATHHLDPFSPSVFLDLPPTPRPGSDGRGEDAALPDDLVLPYISRMLMEEDIDDKFFYLYPDHPALLEAQQPFAEILTDAGHTDLLFSGVSDSAATTDTNVGSFTLSPCSSDDVADATWPHDPFELNQQLRAASDANTFFLPSPGTGQDGGTVFNFTGGGEANHQSSETNTPAILPAADDSVLFSGQSRVSMDMLNQAFLKGMEEANKFLPTVTNNSLLMPRDSNHSHVFAATDQSRKEAVDGSCNRKGRKHRHNWHDDELDGETSTGRRNSKLAAPEQEETGEMVDKEVVDGYDLCLDQMKSLRISMGTIEAARSSHTWKWPHGRREESVDLCTSLIQCAQAVSMSDHRSAAELLEQIKRHASPRGDANQRLAYCFAEGLEARLAGAGSQLYRSLMVKRTSVVEFLRAYRLYLSATCFKMTAYTFANITIKRAVAGRKKVHIVDYGVDFGCQWPYLLEFLAEQRIDGGGPPEVRMTCIDLPEPGFRPAARIEETGRRLTNFARRCGLPFTFQSVAARWETVRAGDLGIDPDEVLVVNSITQFQNLMDDEGVDDVYGQSPNPRDVVLGNIRDMRPDVFVLSVINGAYNAPFFLSRFKEALFYYSAMFDILDATAPRDDEQRLAVERDILGRCALNAVACEGADRVERPETYRQWQARSLRAGLRQLPLCPGVAKALSERTRKQFHKDFVTDVDRQWLVQGWKGRILYAMSTWVADG